MKKSVEQCLTSSIDWMLFVRRIKVDCSKTHRMASLPFSMGIISMLTTHGGVPSICSPTVLHV